MFPQFDCQSTYTSGIDPAYTLLYQVEISIIDEQSEQKTALLWLDQPSDWSLYEAATQVLIKNKKIK